MSSIIMRLAILLVSVILHNGLVYCLVGYDCHHKDIMLKPISLKGVETCPIYDSKPNVTRIDIQLIQRVSTSTSHYVSCSVEYNLYITHCGMHSHASRVRKGNLNGYLPLDRTSCYESIRTKSFTWDSQHRAEHIQINTTNYVTLLLAGKANTEGDCKGKDFSFQGESYSSVVASVNLKITFREGSTKIDMDSDYFQLPNGMTATYSKGSAIDLLYGNTYWDVIAPNVCHSNKYIGIYDGPCQLLSEVSSSSTPRRIVVVKTETQSFTLEIRKSELICNYVVYTTEHPRLLVVMPTSGVSGKFPTVKSDESMDLSLITYINAKFVYVENHIRSQIVSLYEHFMRQSCEIERKALQNLLSTAFISEEEFAFALMKEPGYTGIRRGEIMYVITCVPVSVNVRKTAECYSDLPIVYNNQSKFLSPKSGIIKDIGAQVECLDIMPIWFNLEGQWYNIHGGNMLSSLVPNVLAPGLHQEWTYIVPGDLARSGIYSPEDVMRFEDHLLFPGERSSALDIISRGYSGQNIINQGKGLERLMTPVDYELITESVTKKLWGWMSLIGNWSSGFIGIYLIIRLIKFIINSLINGTLLYRTFGFGYQLLGCVWTNLAHLLVGNKINKAFDNYAQVRKDDNNCQPTDEEVPLQNVKVDTVTHPSAPPIGDVVHQSTTTYPTISKNMYTVQVPALFNLNN